jgi:hypothetical protein
MLYACLFQLLVNTESPVVFDAYKNATKGGNKEHLIKLVKEAGMDLSEEITVYLKHYPLDDGSKDPLEEHRRNDLKDLQDFAKRAASGEAFVKETSAR